MKLMSILSCYCFLLLCGSFNISVGYIQEIEVKAITNTGGIVDGHHHFEGEAPLNRYTRSYNTAKVNGEIHFLSHIPDQVYTKDAHTERKCYGQLTEVYKRFRGTVPNVAMIVEPGDIVMLQCHYCADSKAQVRGARIWMRSRHGMTAADSEVSEVQLDVHDDDEKNRVYTTMDHTLVIRNAKVTDAATYFCVDYEVFRKKVLRLKAREYKTTVMFLMTADNAVFLYHVDVFLRGLTNTILVSRVPGSTLPKPTKDYLNTAENWGIFTKWSLWGPCSVCGDKMYGEKKRKGICEVHELKREEPVRPKKLADLMSIYRLGVPCHSSMFYGFRTVTSRPEQIEIAKCRVKCMNKGKDAEAKNFTTFESFEDIKVEKKITKKRHKFKTHDVEGKEGVSFRMMCPGSTPDTAVSWQNGTTLLRERDVEKRTRGRATIDLTNALFIRNLTKFDSATYTCWYEQRRIAKFKLTVIERPRVPLDEVKDGLTYLGLCYAGSFVIFVACLAVKHKQRMVQVRKKNGKKK